ncbi:MAG: SRPBCC family protein [Deltaproteobacteria bacterium]|nr:SRPBCC family protein [Deltaproteobacteria bacterium]
MSNTMSWKENDETGGNRPHTAAPARALLRSRLLAGLWLLLLLGSGCTSPYRIPDGRYPGFEGEINQHTRLIHAPRATVFYVLTHEADFKAICPEGTVVSHATPPPYRVGTVLETRILHIFKLGWTTRVEEIVPEQKIRLRFLDGFFRGGTEMWRIEDEDGKTRVTHTIIVNPRGVLRKAAWLLKVRRKHDRMVESFLDNLKALAEGRRGRPQPS